MSMVSVYQDQEWTPLKIVSTSSDVWSFTQRPRHETSFSMRTDVPNWQHVCEQQQRFEHSRKPTCNELYIFIAGAYGGSKEKEGECEMK